MKFYISRTSGWWDGKPCEDAVLLTKPKEEPLWGIEINSLEELIEFKERVKEEVILRKTYNDTSYSRYELEIYDTYRE